MLVIVAWVLLLLPSVGWPGVPRHGGERPAPPISNAVQDAPNFELPNGPAKMPPKGGPGGPSVAFRDDVHNVVLKGSVFGLSTKIAGDIGHKNALVLDDAMLRRGTPEIPAIEPPPPDRVRVIVQPSQQRVLFQFASHTDIFELRGNFASVQNADALNTALRDALERLVAGTARPTAIVIEDGGAIRVLPDLAAIDLDRRSNVAKSDTTPGEVDTASSDIRDGAHVGAF